MTTITDTVKPSLVSKARLKWDEVRQKHLLLFPEGLLVLNPTAHAIVMLCDGKRTIAEITGTLKVQFKTDAIGSDVRELLLRLTEKGLILLKEEE